jgi:3-phytase
MSMKKQWTCKFCLILLMSGIFPIGVSGKTICPDAITDTVSVDSDDPAIWINRKNPEASLILGTDKGGRVYAFDLQGKTVQILQQPGMMRMNNIDVEYGFTLGGKSIDIAVATDRDAGLLFAWSLPDFKPLVEKGVPVFIGETDNRPMGIGLYRRPSDGVIFAIVSRKSGPSGAYLHQYRINDKNGTLDFQLVRKFGTWSGTNAAGDGEIEAICVDDETGFVYYSDELFGIRKYHADPDHPDAGRELATFGQTGFADDREGIAIAKQTDGTGILIVSDQGAHQFRAFDLSDGHSYLGSVSLNTRSTDGCEVYAKPLPGYPTGLFVAMSDNQTFHLYHWQEVVLGLHKTP